MEVLLYFAAFYAWQCIKFVPAHATVFIPRFKSIRLLDGGGFRFLNPIPSQTSVISARLPFLITRRGVQCWTPLRRFGGDQAEDYPRTVPFGALKLSHVSGSVIRIDGQPFVRTTSNAEASVFGRRLVSLARSSPEAHREAFAQVVAESLSVTELRHEFNDATETVRLLGWICDVYLIAVLVAAPILMLFYPEDRALLLLLPTVGILHVVALIELFRTHRRLFPQLRAERAELLLTCGLFPPTLLRTPQSMFSETVMGFHPAAVAGVVLGSAQAVVIFRREVARTRYRLGATIASELDSESEETPHLRRIQEDLLIDCAAEFGLSRQEIFEPRPRRDEHANSYCPLCLADYVSQATRCSDCLLPTVSY